jgi:hypothetical protein
MVTHLKYCLQWPKYCLERPNVTARSGKPTQCCIQLGTWIHMCHALDSFTLQMVTHLKYCLQWPKCCLERPKVTARSCKPAQCCIHLGTWIHICYSYNFLKRQLFRRMVRQNLHDEKQLIRRSLIGIHLHGKTYPFRSAPPLSSTLSVELTGFLNCIFTQRQWDMEMHL